MIAFKCPMCGAALKAADNRAGRRSKCPKCGRPVQVPRQSGSIAAAVVTEVAPTEASKATIPSKSPSPGTPISGSLDNSPNKKAEFRWDKTLFWSGIVLVLYFAVIYDTTTPTFWSLGFMRVHNIGLMQNQNIGIWIGLFCTAVGIALTIAGRQKNRS